MFTSGHPADRRLRPAHFLAGMVMLFLGAVLINLEQAALVGAAFIGLGGLYLVLGLGVLRLRVPPFHRG